MTNKDKKAEQWKEAKVLCKLNDEDIRIAKEMGLNPLSLIKNIPAKDQLWKAPVKKWLRAMYEERQGKSENNTEIKSKVKLTIGIKSSD
ncbi:hypothetical protein [Cohnella sp. WQ 127256]|uniref:hypothetical protein n=1 Tax=Cohnella sp. WQ 127256 TaxID=2938790 RepID=UPI0021196C93|nr:hypothetical protein [Cohnella sp. WQ 127256]